MTAIIARSITGVIRDQESLLDLIFIGPESDHFLFFCDSAGCYLSMFLHSRGSLGSSPERRMVP